MTRRRVALPLALILSLTVFAGARAQPAELDFGEVPPELTEAIWCSSIFFEEAHRHEEEDEELAAALFAIADDLGMDAMMALIEDGWTEEEADAIWASPDSVAFFLAQEDREAFLEEFEACHEATGASIVLPE